MFCGLGEEERTKIRKKKRKKKEIKGKIKEKKGKRKEKKRNELHRGQKWVGWDERIS